MPRKKEPLRVGVIDCPFCDVAKVEVREDARGALYGTCNGKAWDRGAYADPKGQKCGARFALGKDHSDDLRKVLKNDDANTQGKAAQIIKGETVIEVRGNEYNASEEAPGETIASHESGTGDTGASDPGTGDTGASDTGTGDTGASDTGTGDSKPRRKRRKVGFF